MAMGAAIKLRRIMHNVRHVIAIELLCAGQGIDFRRPLRAGHGVEKAHAMIRQRVSMMDRDRPLAPDIASLADAVNERVFVGLGEP